MKQVYGKITHWKYTKTEFSQCYIGVEQHQIWNKQFYWRYTSVYIHFYYTYLSWFAWILSICLLILFHILFVSNKMRANWVCTLWYLKRSVCCTFWIQTHCGEREWLFVNWASFFQACAMNDAYFVLYLIGVQTAFIRTLVNQERKKKRNCWRLRENFWFASNSTFVSL